MGTVRQAMVGTADAARPRPELIRLRFRVSLDMLLTLGVTALAIVLVVGYQVLGRIDRFRPSSADRGIDA